MSSSTISTPAETSALRTPAGRPLSRLSGQLWRALTPSAAGPARGRTLEAVRRVMETRLDARRLRERLPELTGPPQGHDRLRVSLLPLYSRFVARVAPPASAMSLEVAGFLLDLCEQRRPQRILEVGTGFASAVLRRIGESPGWIPEIWSAEEDPERLARVRAFLAQEALPTDRLLPWQELSETAEGGFDLVVHELVPAARSILAGLLERVTTGGFLLLDGAHRPALERSARHVLDAAGAEHFSLRALTRDCFGRHALLALR